MKLISLYKTYDGTFYREWRGESINGNFVIVRDILSEIQLGVDEREINALFKVQTYPKKQDNYGFWNIFALLKYLTIEPPDGFIELN